MPAKRASQATTTASNKVKPTTTATKVPSNPYLVKAEKPHSPITLLDLVDAVIYHYSGFAGANATQGKSLHTKTDVASSSTITKPSQILWALRSYCVSAAAQARLVEFVVAAPPTEANDYATFDLTPIVTYINDLLSRSSSTHVANAFAERNLVDGTKSHQAAPGSKRAREETADGADAESITRLSDPTGGHVDGWNESFGGNPFEPDRTSLMDISTFFDFTGFMAWRSTSGHSNGQHLASIDAIGSTSSAPNHVGEGDTSNHGASVTSLSALRTNLLSPTSSTTSHHNANTSAYFERCRRLVPYHRALPFPHDGAFIAACELINYISHLTIATNNLQVPPVLQAEAQKVLDKAQLPLQVLIMCSNACHALIQVICSARLAVTTEKPPRVIRLAASFNLTHAESAALAYILSVHGGSLINHTIAHPLSFALVCRMSGLDPRGLQRFIQNDRHHVKQGVIMPTDHLMAKVTPDMRIVMPLEVVSTLCGINIQEEELVKLENTCLWNILQCEKTGNFGIIAPKTSKTASAAAAYLASSKVTNAGATKKKVTFGNKELMSALGDLLEGTTGKDDDSGSSSGDSEAGPESPRTPAGSAIVASEADFEGLAEDDATSSKVGGSTENAISSRPYTNDIEFLDDSFKVVAMMIKARNSEGDMKDEEDLYYATPKSKVEAQLREFAGKQRAIQKRVELRMAATRAAGPWVPRIEKVSERLRLSDFEKQLLTLMVGNVVSHDVLVAINGRSVMRDGARELTVGYILFVLCASLSEMVACRQCFYKSSPLIANGLITLSIGSSSRTVFNTDLMEYLVDVDRSIVGYLMGTDLETDEMVQGSKLYSPDVPMSHVALPSSVKTKVLSTIEHYGLFARCKERCGFGKGLGTGGSGLVFLFHGPSGTGKTMLANAVAHDLKKRILLVNLLQYRGDSKAPDILRYVFREAKLNDAIIFFDECESFFEQRENNTVVTAVLAEFERYSGMIILATNRAQVIDEAMNRRISLMIEFKLPDHQAREQIWATHLPQNLKTADDVSVQQLAMDYELTGGLIRNAVLAAMSSAVAREKSETPTLTMTDLRMGAKQQLRGFFQAHEAASQEYITPLRSLNEVIVDSKTKEQIVNIAKIVKSRNTLFAQWGFDEKEYDDQGDICLFYGPSGTGKSLAAEGIAYECSTTIRLCNISEMFVTNTFNIQAVFDEARKLGAIVVFDQAQGLFDYSDIAGKISQLIQYHAVRYPRPVIVIATTSPTGVSSIDTRASRLQFNSEIAFQLPTRALRKELWRRSIPPQVPLDENVNFDQLSAEQLSAKAIRSICFSVCCKAALLPVGKQVVSMGLIQDTQEEFLSRERRRNTHSSMFT